MPACEWCGQEAAWCDCKERANCKKAGLPGHRQCGKWDCGCPRFAHPEGEHERCPNCITGQDKTCATCGGEA